jgi:hypothetical protein
MPNVYFVQNNPAIDVQIVAVPAADPDNLYYTAGGGEIFGNQIKDDLITGGFQAHIGNPKLDGVETPIYKKENKVTVITETIKIEGPKCTRGLFIYRTTSPAADPHLKTSGRYYWDEVYTSPLGFQEVIGSNTATGQFSLTGNVMKVRTNDVNIIPKVGDFIILQKVNNAQYLALPTDTTTASASYTDGFSNMPVIFNTETYQFKIDAVNYTTPSSKSTEYTLTLDKSVALTIGDRYGIVFLNRENTGLQKELFYDTFEQVEVHRSQLLGDPYDNSSLNLPLGRKNYLNYNNAEYLGLRNLLSGIINEKNEKLIETPFLVFDIQDEIKDRFLPIASTVTDVNFEFHLPTVMLQEDTANKLNILVNSGAVQTDTDGVGRYSKLYLKWADPLTSKSYGYIFYDLRIIVIDDSELATALSYNSNRNYTLPRATFNSTGNQTPNAISSVNLDILHIENSSPMIVIVNGNHGLETGTAITITDASVKVPGTNNILASSANGVKYIERVITGATEKKDRFKIYDNSSLTTPTTGNGEFVNNGVGNSGKVRGAKLAYDYFFTYRVKNGRYTSTLPYSEVRSFNFAASLNESTVDNITGSLYLRFPAFTYLNHTNGGYTISDFEFIIGKWEANDPARPFEVTGIEDVVVISVNQLATSSLPSNSMAKMENGLGAFAYGTNTAGDPTYDIYDNLKHYNITSGTFESTLYTAEGKWTLGNISYKTEVEQYRAKIQIVIGANEWNDTTNPSYNPVNTFMNEKCISEVAIVPPTAGDDKPLIYTKIAPPIEKSPNMDLILNLSVDY